MNTVSRRKCSGRQCSMKAATLLSSIFSLFSLSWLLPCNAAICELCIYLPLAPLFFLLRALFADYCVQRLLSASKHFFFLPSHLTVYCLFKGASAHFKTKTKMNCFNAGPLYRPLCAARLQRRGAVTDATNKVK